MFVYIKKVGTPKEESLVVNLKVIPKRNEYIVCQFPKDSFELTYVVKQIYHTISLCPDGTKHTIEIVVERG